MNFPKMTDKPVKCSQCRKNIDFKESILALRACEFLYREGAEHMQARNKTNFFTLNADFLTKIYDYRLAKFKTLLRNSLKGFKCFRKLVIRRISRLIMPKIP